MTTWLLTDPIFLQHRTGRHPECRSRLRKITEHLSGTGLPEACRSAVWTPASREQLEAVHAAEHVDRVRALADAGGGSLDADTVVCDQSYDVALQAAGAACKAVDLVLDAAGEAHALGLVRPPGHHAVPQRAMGFCLFNNIAVAARHALAQGLDRVLIVDWDVHHGNGTQDVFYEDERVGFVSLHRWPFYPGTGASDETGSGAGLGTTVNVPLSFGISRREYLQAFESAVSGLADRMRPQLVLLSAGFDAHRLDPIGSLGLESEDFAELTDLILGVARQHCGGKLVSLLEGGYNLDVLPVCVEQHLRRLAAPTAET